MGTALEPRNYKRSFDKALQRAGLDHLRIDDMRHTAASILLAQNVSSRVISEILGHAWVGITLDIYTHLDEPQRQEAASRMDEALGMWARTDTEGLDGFDGSVTLGPTHLSSSGAWLYT